MPAQQDFHDLLFSFVRSYRYLVKCDRCRRISPGLISRRRDRTWRVCIHSFLSLFLSFSPSSSSSSSSLFLSPWRKVFAADSIDKSWLRTCWKVETVNSPSSKKKHRLPASKHVSASSKPEWMRHELYTGCAKRLTRYIVVGINSRRNKLMGLIETQYFALLLAYIIFIRRDRFFKRLSTSTNIERKKILSRRVSRQYFQK